MSRSKKVRVPRTTAQLVVGLARILREQMGLVITKHEHWELERVADWTTGEDEITGCHSWEHDCHLAVGDAEIRQTDGATLSKGKLRIRARIQKNDWVELGYPDNFYWWIDIWVLMPDGTIMKGRYDFWNDSHAIYLNEDTEIPDRPPSKIDFWQKTA